jgi:hypothetical protein
MGRNDSRCKVIDKDMNQCGRKPAAKYCQGALCDYDYGMTTLLVLKNEEEGMNDVSS